MAVITPQNLKVTGQIASKASEISASGASTVNFGAFILVLVLAIIYDLLDLVGLILPIIMDILLLPLGLIIVFITYLMGMRPIMNLIGFGLDSIPVVSYLPIMSMSIIASYLLMSNPRLMQVLQKGAEIAITAAVKAPVGKLITKAAGQVSEKMTK